MLKTVFVSDNPLDNSEWECFDNIDDLFAFFKSKYPTKWPVGARLYNKYVSKATEVTPTDWNEATRKKLDECEGPFYWVIRPNEPITIAIALVVAVLAVVVLTMKKPPTPTIRNQQAGSANNSLSGRTNEARYNGRIADIYGTVRSVPDMVAPEFFTFKDNVEFSNSLMVIGVGKYLVRDVRDDTTLISNIPGSSVEVYEPFTSPNSGHQPQLRIGNPINRPMEYVKRSNSITGQELRAPNDNYIKGEFNIGFQGPNIIRSSAINFENRFVSGDTITIADAKIYANYVNETRTISADTDGTFDFPAPSIPSVYSAGKDITITGALFVGPYDSEAGSSLIYDLSGTYVVESVSMIMREASPGSGVQPYCKVKLVNPVAVNPKWAAAVMTISTTAALRINDGSILYDLSGQYTVLSVSETEILLDDPASVNPVWIDLPVTANISPILSATGVRRVGPIFLDDKDLSKVIINLVALNGLYRQDSSGNQERVDVALKLELEPADANGNPIGSPQPFDLIIQGSANTQDLRGATFYAVPTFTGPCNVYISRTSPIDLSERYTVVDKISFRDLYSVSNIAVVDYGNVTIVQSQTIANSYSLSTKQRKLNMLVTRMIPVRMSGSQFSEQLYATNDAAEIISHIAMTPTIGNRSAEEIDFDNIYDTVAEVKEYFGTPLAAEFCYTFDKDNLSFENTLSIIANAIFCTAFRRGSILQLFFEKKTDFSSLLFNHRNKVPRSEKRSVRFGYDNENDGLEFEYTNPEDETTKTLYFPTDRTAVNPRKEEGVGVRNHVQAHFLAWRMWQKIQFQNVGVTFTSTDEANLLIRNERVLVADNTRPNTQDGYIKQQNGFALRCSQPLVFAEETDYAIHLQLSDKTVEMIPVTAGPDEYTVMLSRAPRVPLVTENDRYVKTAYILVGNNDRRVMPMLVLEKKPKNTLTVDLQVANYDDRFYTHDFDFINGLITE